jgi:hypothetical protein
MNAGGWIFILFSWMFIIGLSVYCFYRVFAKKELK